ncbi:tetraacyldisaccharide 4'-kinase [Noviherbaspirillum saxi]|uniref:Tetraacyldisaccharide 4'-kinase n=1 Tax=Noviherbaspirillum saxi TaxID=2320863 RepID=A0A3A3FUF5_9BURK|nr:tetraacyldisaccharide 4'-kinase [Noviherbaspirillum saxi]RJF99180.1 tetraacyldisaccharide 4'-kinase [Noviherbaspirillum saxi]
MTSPAESVLARAWRRRGPLACLLFPVSLLFRLLVSLRRALYRAGWLRSTRLPVPVIIVGNVFVGGTGKTPFTIWLIEQLRAAGFSPGVISRGYGGKNALPVEVGPDARPAQVGDEPALIAARAGCPVMIGRDRVAVAQALLAAHPAVDVIVSDDGLQHYALERDVEIVMCDERGDGNGWMLPAGPLREPAARPRDFTVVNAAHLPPLVLPPAYRMQLSGEVAERLSDRGHAIPLGNIRAPRIVAAAGIGNPARFFGMLKKAGLTIEPLPLPDHYDYADNPFARLPADIILITEKDAVKCTQIDTMKTDPRLWVVPVTARIDSALAKRIVEKCRGRPTA